MNVGSLFAGIGGFGLGFERAGMRISWQVEQNACRRGVLARHLPDAVLGNALVPPIAERIGRRIGEYGRKAAVAASQGEAVS